MMLHGLCRMCQKFRPVQVSVPPVNGVAIGVCLDCLEGKR